MLHIFLKTSFQLFVVRKFLFHNYSANSFLFNQNNNISTKNIFLSSSRIRFTWFRFLNVYCFSHLLLKYKIQLTFILFFNVAYLAPLIDFKFEKIRTYFILEHSQKKFTFSIGGTWFQTSIYLFSKKIFLIA